MVLTSNSAGRNDLRRITFAKITKIINFDRSCPCHRARRPQGLSSWTTRRESPLCSSYLFSTHFIQRCPSLPPNAQPFPEFLLRKLHPFSRLDTPNACRHTRPSTPAICLSLLHDPVPVLIARCKERLSWGRQRQRHWHLPHYALPPQQVLQSTLGSKFSEAQAPVRVSDTQTRRWRRRVQKRRGPDGGRRRLRRLQRYRPRGWRLTWTLSGPEEAAALEPVQVGFMFRQHPRKSRLSYPKPRSPHSPSRQSVDTLCSHRPHHVSPHLVRHLEEC